MSTLSNTSDSILVDRQIVGWEDVYLPSLEKSILLQFIKEQRYQKELRQYNLPVNNKILLHGDSGCGKTMTAKALANTLGRPLYILDLSTIVSARIGETSKNLKAVFEKAGRERAILFLDEFDQLGSMRSTDDKDVGEMRRLVNSLLQLIDYFPENAVLIAATNHLALLDTALLRRFQLRIAYQKPDDSTLDSYYDKLLAPLPIHLHKFERLYQLSFAEAKDDCYTKIKGLLIQHLEEMQQQEAAIQPS